MHLFLGHLTFDWLMQISWMGQKTHWNHGAGGAQPYHMTKVCAQVLPQRQTGRDQ